MARRKRKPPSLLQKENIIKGRVFELVLKKLIEKAGFNLNVSTDQLVSYKKRRIRGRGSTYDLDFIGEFPIIIPFSYPSLLIGEAKYWKKALDLKEAREFLGAFTDISQYPRIDTSSRLPKYSQIFLNKRYSYVPVIFSKSGFHRNAQALLWTHGIYFISYENSTIFQEIIPRIERFLKKINYEMLDRDEMKKLTSLEAFKQLKNTAKKNDFDSALDSLLQVLEPIKSYLGILDRLWPIHFLYKGKRELRPSLKTRESSFIIKENQVIVKRTTHKNSTNLGFFTLPKFFFQEYKKIAEKYGKRIFRELILYIPVEGKVFPYYIKLKERSKNE
ncbi:MAG: hypothetical protein J7K72_03710 [Candidatus Aenigmarchaeota archaeon]|nr:hypothetical protein [Candidatus Aenigmarchaeota archaeon]